MMSLAFSTESSNFATTRRKDLMSPQDASEKREKGAAILNGNRHWEPGNPSDGEGISPLECPLGTAPRDDI